MKTKNSTKGLSRRALLAGMTAGGAALAFGRPAWAQQGDLIFWSQFAGSKGPAGEALEAAFSAAHPDVSLSSTVYAQPAQLNEKVLTSLSGNTAPDLIVQHWDYNLTYANGDKLLDLSTAMKGTDLAALDANLLAYGKINGGQYSVPMYGTSRGIGMNRTLIAAAGLDPDSPPQNWAEFTEWAIAATQRAENGLLQVAGFNLFQNDLDAFEVFALFLQGADGTILTADQSAPAFAGPEGIEALQYLSDLVHVHKVTDVGYGLGPGGLAGPFNNSRTAMIIAGNYSTNNALRGGVDFDIFPIPKKNGGFTSLVDPFAYGVPSSGANTEAAIAFVEFALKPEQQIAFALASKNVPVLIEAQSHPEIMADKYLAKFVEVAQYAPPQAPAIPAFSRLVTILARSVQEVLFQRQTAEEALKTAEAQVAEVLSRG